MVPPFCLPVATSEGALREHRKGPGHFIPSTDVLMTTIESVGRSGSFPMTRSCGVTRSLFVTCSTELIWNGKSDFESLSCDWR